MVNIYLNDRFEKAIALTVEAGVVYHKYRVSIPLRSFQAGMNDLRFSPRLVPLITGECQIYNTENLILTIFDDSTLSMPKASHYVAMPSLRLLVKTGFPYTVKSGGAGTLVHVASNDSKTIASAWMLLAKLAQRHLRALDQALISFGLPQSQDHELIVVGSIGRVQPNLLKGAPLEYAKLSRVPYSVAVEQPSGERTTGGPLQWLLPGTSRSLERGGADVDPASLHHESGERSHESTLTGNIARHCHQAGPRRYLRRERCPVARHGGKISRNCGGLQAISWSGARASKPSHGRRPKSITMSAASGAYAHGVLFFQLSMVLVSALMALIVPTCSPPGRNRYRRRNHAETGQTVVGTC